MYALMCVFLTCVSCRRVHSTQRAFAIKACEWCGITRKQSKAKQSTQSKSWILTRARDRKLSNPCGEEKNGCQTVKEKLLLTCALRSNVELTRNNTLLFVFLVSIFLCLRLCTLLFPAIHMQGEGDETRRSTKQTVNPPHTPPPLPRHWEKNLKCVANVFFGPKRVEKTKLPALSELCCPQELRFGHFFCTFSTFDQHETLVVLASDTRAFRTDSNQGGGGGGGGHHLTAVASSHGWPNICHKVS